MNPHITAIKVPGSSDISKQLQGADYFDSYEMPLEHAGRSALEIYLGVISKTPAWVNVLMAARNKVVGFFGLKNLGHLGDLQRTKAASDYRIGDRIGIFTLLSNTDNELIMGDSDKHLDVKVSICKLGQGGNESVASTTVVHIHNLLGRVYMLFVIPLHKLIVPAVLVRAVK
jgi:Protein of unknown function (DUF2867)